MIKLIAITLILGLAQEAVLAQDQGVNWALLVAGSNEYYNYRHQVRTFANTLDLC